MAKETLQQYLNRELDEKGVSSRNHKKNAGKYKSISAAKKADSLYYTNKDGKIMAAVFEKDLKEKPTEKKLAPKKTMRPKARNQVSDRVGAIIKTEPIIVTTISGKDNEKRKESRARDNKKTDSSDRGKSFGTRVRKKKSGGPDPLGLFGKKTYVSAIAKKQKLKSYTYKQWKAMSEEKRKNLRLPIKTYPGSEKLKVVQKPLK